MCECGCGAMIPYEVLKINGNKYIVIEKYKGCNYCTENPIGISLYFYDKNGYEEWLRGCNLNEIEIRFDDWGGNSQHYGVFGQEELLQVIDNMREELNAYDNDEDLQQSLSENVKDFFVDEGLNFLKKCIKMFEDTIERKK